MPTSPTKAKAATSAGRGSRRDGRRSTKRPAVTVPKNQTVRSAQSQCCLRTACAIPGSQMVCEAARPVTYAATAPHVPSTYKSVATWRSGVLRRNAHPMTSTAAAAHSRAIGKCTNNGWMFGAQSGTRFMEPFFRIHWTRYWAVILHGETLDH